MSPLKVAVPPTKMVEGEPVLTVLETVTLPRLTTPPLSAVRVPVPRPLLFVIDKTPLLTCTPPAKVLTPPRTRVPDPV